MTHKYRLSRTIPIIGIALLLLSCIGCAKALVQKKVMRQPSHLQADMSTLTKLQAKIKTQQGIIEQTNKQAALPNIPNRAKLCQTICRASKHICLASTQICKLAFKYQSLPFRRACQRAQKDCQQSKTSCQNCR